MLPTGKARKVSYIEEEVQAWEECHCDEGWIHGFDPVTGWERSVKCEDCHGEGGRWHEALECNSSSPDALAHLIGADYGRYSWAEKSSLLIRRWKVHDFCDGNGCSRCAWTCCEPDSQGPWEIK